MQKLFENWRRYRNEALAEKRAGPLVYATDASAGFEKARELDRDRKVDHEAAEADHERAMKEAMAEIDAHRTYFEALSPLLSELIEELIVKITIIVAAKGAASSVPYILSQIISGSEELHVGRFGGKRKIRQFLQKVLSRWVPVIGLAMIVKDIYDYLLSAEAEENRAAIVLDLKEIIDSIKVPASITI